MVEEFHNDYSGAYDATFRSKLADYEDSIKELISIEEGGNYFAPPVIEGRSEFYQDVKNSAKKSIELLFTSTELTGTDFLFGWIIYHSFDDP